MRMMKRSLVGLLMLSTSGTIFGLPVKNRPEIKSTMQQFYKEISVLLPLSLDDEAFFDKKKDTQIKTSLKKLDELSKSLGNSTKVLGDEAVGQIASEFKYFSQEAYTAFNNGHKPKAQALIQYQSESCMSCHTMRGSQSEPKLKLDFLAQIAYEDLGPWEKARFLTIARQFSASMNEYERLLSSAELSDSQKILSNAYLEYLVLGLRVKDDMPRVKSFLKKRVASSDPAIVKEALVSWVDTIEKVESIKKPWSMETAKHLMKLGEGHKRFPADRRGMVYYIIASKIIRAEVESLDRKDVLGRAKAQFLLGQCELVLDAFNFKSLNYFAKAIKLAPSSKFAAEALRLYKEHLYLSFSGSSGTHIPEREMAMLKELTGLVKNKM